MIATKVPQKRSLSLPADRGSAVFPTLYWFLLAALALGWVVALAVGWSEAMTLLLALILTIPIGFIARGLPNAIDARWLSKLIVLGFIAKLGASSARYWVLEYLYNGVGDASGYHNHGILYAPIWRSFQLPPIDTGTAFVQAFTGLIYVPRVPTLLGGFIVFATLAFLGQVLLYAAFRRTLPSARVKWYAILIFFFPNLLYWPSSIGKESLMILFLGIGAYGAARLFADYQLRWMLIAAIGLVGCAVIRSHIALLFAVSMAGAILVGRSPRMEFAKVRRIALILVTGVILIAVARFTSQDFNIDLTNGINEALLEDEIDPIFAGVEEQTSRGGSAVTGSGISGLADVPEAFMRVVFRPLPPDAHNAQALINSLVEGTVLLGLFIWRLPAIVRNLPRMWRSSYVLFSLIYSAGFIVGHSGILNLGIVARQRAQLLPFLFVLLVELGSRVEPRVASEAGAAEPPQPRKFAASTR